MGFERRGESREFGLERKNVPKFFTKIKMQEHVMNKLVSSKINALLRQRNLFLKSVVRGGRVFSESGPKFRAKEIRRTRSSRGRLPKPSCSMFLLFFLLISLVPSGRISRLSCKIREEIRIKEPELPI